MPSSQAVAAPGLHEPPLQASPLVQALLSLQEPVFWAKTQPPALVQVSSVQGLPSEQTSVLAGVQLPPLQISPLVQASPSSQAKVLAA